MAYFSNSIQGIPQVGADFNVYDNHSTDRYAVGTRIQRQDGSEFVYAGFAADTAQGLLVSQDLSASALLDAAVTVVALASVATSGDNVAGQRYVEVTGTATANQFAGGYFSTIDETGEGYTYRIRGNTATGNPVALNFRLELYDPLQASVTDDTQCNIIGSMYASLRPATAATDNIVSGVCISDVTVADAAYGWVQTKGFATILGEGAGIAAGAVLALSDATAGACQLKDAETEPVIGYCVALAADTEYAGVYLQL